MRRCVCPKYKGLKNWQTLLDYLSVSKRICVGAHALKGEMRCVCQFFIPSHLEQSQLGKRTNSDRLPNRAGGVI